jgi:hypothetical protein
MHRHRERHLRFGARERERCETIGVGSVDHFISTICITMYHDMSDRGRGEGQHVVAGVLVVDDPLPGLVPLDH